MNRRYQLCTRCVMDSSDPDNWFTAEGHCRRCTDFMLQRQANWRSPSARERALSAVVEKIRRAGRGRPYDCVVGVSGGVDSTYTILLVKQLGLRPLAVHLDNGWDSETAVLNMEMFLNTLGVDLYTHVLDWDEFSDLQLAFLRA